MCSFITVIPSQLLGERRKEFSGVGECLFVTERYDSMRKPTGEYLISGGKEDEDDCACSLHSEESGGDHYFDIGQDVLPSLMATLKHIAELSPGGFIFEAEPWWGGQEPKRAELSFSEFEKIILLNQIGANTKYTVKPTE